MPSATQEIPTASPCCEARYASAPQIRRAKSIFVTSPDAKFIEPEVSRTRTSRRLVSASYSLT